ncbi:hypothetical protein CDAR_522371 [Caerostris darwini]|uniref:Uncharacterized protein n=1 Tax=Caerostris darwini TaxID=1538125 RepID=A0AAV4VPD2_9ARAC|nr:hypothetical protein CDAR_522371 [Caerostris darwini]
MCQITSDNLEEDPSLPTPLIIYYTSPVTTPDSNMDIENGKDTNSYSPAAQLKELTDEYVLINQVVLRKNSNFKERLTQTATKLRKTKIEMTELYKQIES